MSNKGNGFSFINQMEKPNSIKPSKVSLNKGLDLSEEEETVEEVTNENNEEVQIIEKNYPKGKKNLLFIENCVVAYQNLEYSKNERVTLNINPEINQKLKLLSVASKVSAFELGNAIINNFFELHQKEIATLIKKLQI